MLIPPQEDRDLVHRSIYQELCLGKVLDGSRTEYCRIASDLVKRGRSSHIPWTLHPMALRDVVPDD